MRKSSVLRTICILLRRWTFLGAVHEPPLSLHGARRTGTEHVFFVPLCLRALVAIISAVIIISLLTSSSLLAETEKEKQKQQQTQTQASSPAAASAAENIAAEGKQPAERQTISAPKKYVGEPGTFIFHQAELKNVLIFFSRTYKFNLVIDPGISGKVTIRLINVPWDQALDLILTQNGLAMTKEGYLYILKKMDK